MTISFAILLSSVLLEALGRGFPWDGPLVVGHKLASPIDENDASLCIFVTDLWTRRQHVPPTPSSRGGGRCPITGDAMTFTFQDVLLRHAVDQMQQ